MDAHFQGGHFAPLKSNFRHFLSRFGRGGLKHDLFSSFLFYHWKALVSGIHMQSRKLATEQCKLLKIEVHEVLFEF